MKLIKVGDRYFANSWRTEIDKNGSFEYFVSGEGWKKTKKFTVVDGVELPERWDKNLTWLDVARLYDQYGIEVANVYAECMTAGIVSKQTARGYGLIYGKIKHLIDENFDSKFFELLRCDYMLSCFGLFLLGIIGLDDKFGKMDSEYNPSDVKYKGKDCSMRQYVLQKYGQKYVDIIEAANKS